MNLPSILLLIAVIAAVIASLRFLLRAKKAGLFWLHRLSLCNLRPEKPLTFSRPLTGIVRGRCSIATTHQEPLEETGLFLYKLLQFIDLCSTISSLWFLSLKQQNSKDVIT